MKRASPNRKNKQRRVKCTHVTLSEQSYKFLGNSATDLKCGHLLATNSCGLEVEVLAIFLKKHKNPKKELMGLFCKNDEFWPRCPEKKIKWALPRYPITLLQGPSQRLVFSWLARSNAWLSSDPEVGVMQMTRPHTCSQNWKASVGSRASEGMHPIFSKEKEGCVLRTPQESSQCHPFRLTLALSFLHMYSLPSIASSKTSKYLSF